MNQQQYERAVRVIQDEPMLCTANWEMAWDELYGDDLEYYEEHIQGNEKLPDYVHCALGALIGDIFGTSSPNQPIEGVLPEVTEVFGLSKDEQVALYRANDGADVEIRKNVVISWLRRINES